MAVVVFSYSSRLARGAVLLTVIGFILLCISFATPYWRSSDARHEGLWDSCQNDVCTRLYSPDTLKSRLADGVDGIVDHTHVTVGNVTGGTCTIPDLHQNGSNTTSTYEQKSFSRNTNEKVTGWFQAVEVLEIIGLILSFGALVISFLYAFVPPVSSRTSAKWSIVTSFVSGVCVLAGAIIYSQKTTNVHGLDLSWSFGLNLVACAVLALGGILLIVASRQQRVTTEGL